MEKGKCVICKCWLSQYTEGNICHPCNYKEFHWVFKGKKWQNGALVDQVVEFNDKEKAIEWVRHKRRVSYKEAVKYVLGG